MPSTPNDLIPVGRIAGVFGLHGDLKCDPSNAGRTLFLSGEVFFARFADGSGRDVEVSAVREHKGRLLIHLREVDSLEAAQPYCGAELCVERSRIALGAREYLDRDLAGCEIYDGSGKRLGQVSAVEHYPASDMLVVGHSMVPMVSQFIKSIDLTARRILVELPPGLLDDE